MIRFFALIFPLFLHACCGGIAFAQTYVEKQAGGFNNLLDNPGFENGLARWATAAECSLGTVPFSGIRNIGCVGVTTAKTLFQQSKSVSEYRPYIGEWFKASCRVVGNSDVVEICALKDGSEVECKKILESVSLNAVGMKEYSIPFQIPESQNAAFTVGVRVKTTGTTTTAVNGDACEVKPFKGFVGLIPEPQVFNVSVQSNGTVLAETGGDWINGNCTNASAPVCTFTSGWFGGTTPICYQGINGTSYMVSGVAVTSSTVSGITRNSSDSGVSSHRFIQCHRVPGDPKYQEKTVVDAYGLVPGETIFSATVSSSGVLSNIVNGKYFSATTFAPTDTSLFSIGFTGLNTPPNCQITVTTNDNTAGYTGKKETSETNTGVGVRTGWTSANVSFTKAAVPFTISCQLTGADHTRVRSTYDNVPMGDVQAIFGNTTGSCTASPCTLTDKYPSDITLTRSATGRYQINVPAKYCSSKIACGVMASTNISRQPTTPTSTAYAFYTENTGGTQVDGEVNFNCTCKK